MTAREAISPVLKRDATAETQRIGGDTPLIETLPLLLEAPGRRLAVGDEAEIAGVIDESSMLEALGHMIAPRHDCVVIELQCAPGDYSASHIARAVEDADVHLVDLLTRPGREGLIEVTLRVRCDNPDAVVHSLERYGYEVSSTSANTDSTQAIVAFERLLELQALINI